MAGRGPQTFQKRQKEQQRKEKQQEKIAKRLQRRQESRTADGSDNDDIALYSEAEIAALEASDSQGS